MSFVEVLPTILVLILVLTWKLGETQQIPSIFGTRSNCPNFPPGPSNGFVARLVNGSYVHVCDEGFKLSGEHVQQCVNNRIQGSVPTCIPDPDKDCTGRVTPKLYRGHVHVSQNRSEVLHEYSCIEGYLLEGPSNRACINGVLEGRKPRCLSTSAIEPCDYVGFIIALGILATSLTVLVLGILYWKYREPINRFLGYPERGTYIDPKDLQQSPVEVPSFQQQQPISASKDTHQSYLQVLGEGNEYEAISGQSEAGGAVYYEEVRTTFEDQADQSIYEVVKEDKGKLYDDAHGETFRP